jgi:tRNA dimethylallyltransferase
VEAVASPLIGVVGPTGAGKSALGLRLARGRGGEIVSCDSLQVYRGLDVGSAKATREERQAVPHHLVDVVDVDEPFSAAEYARLSRAAVADVARRGRLPLVVGGTGLYLKALLEGLFEGPSRDEALRERLEGLARRFGDARLHRYLALRDASAAARIRPRDRVRIVRALEVLLRTGRPISEHHRGGARGLEGYRTLLVGLDLPRDVLRRRVEARTRAMIEGGLVDEVKAVLAAGYPADLRPLRAIGYRQALAVLQGDMSLAEAEPAIVTETMRLAKRQMTWFRHQARVTWFPDPDSAHAAAVSWLDSGGNPPSGPVDPSRPGPTGRSG